MTSSVIFHAGNWTDRPHIQLLCLIWHSKENLARTVIYPSPVAIANAATFGPASDYL